jgi:hypothetical protein
MTFTFTLPFPGKELSSNASPGHWSQRSRPRKKYRTACGWEAIAQGLGKIDAKALEVAYTFFPPARYGYDEDGLGSRMKSATDAISDVTGINDRYFSFPRAVIGGYVKPGHVKVVLTWAIETREAA